MTALPCIWGGGFRTIITQLMSAINLWQVRSDLSTGASATLSNIGIVIDPTLVFECCVKRALHILPYYCEVGFTGDTAKNNIQVQFDKQGIG